MTEWHEEMTASELGRMIMETIDDGQAVLVVPSRIVFTGSPNAILERLSELAIEQRHDNSTKH